MCSFKFIVNNISTLRCESVEVKIVVCFYFPYKASNVILNTRPFGSTGGESVTIAIKLGEREARVAIRLVISRTISIATLVTILWSGYVRAAIVVVYTGVIAATPINAAIVKAYSSDFSDNLLRCCADRASSALGSAVIESLDPIVVGSVVA